jgi:hypothetical protein
MPLIFLSTFEFWSSSALITLSPGMCGPWVTVPSMRPPTAPPAGLPAVPTVPRGPSPPLAPDGDPDEFAVPAPFMPGVLLSVLVPLPAPLGSFPELFSPPTFPGPVTPLTAAVPAPAEPALGAAPVPVLPVPVEAAPAPPPAAAPPPDDAPPADPPPPPPPPPAACAAENIVPKANINANARAGAFMVIPFARTTRPTSVFRSSRGRRPYLSSSGCTQT